MVGSGCLEIAIPPYGCPPKKAAGSDQAMKKALKFGSPDGSLPLRSRFNVPRAEAVAARFGHFSLKMFKRL
jgi:hypothetical protein